MSRQLYADSLVPAAGKSGIPYADETKVVRQLGQHHAEAFTGTITGAGGVGGMLDLPFDPGYVEVVNVAGTPRTRKLFVGGAVQIDGTGATATGLSIASDAAGKPRRVTLSVAIAANAEVVQVLAFGFRNVNGSL